MNTTWRTCLAAAACLVAAMGAQAQDFPSKPIRIVMGFPAGGPLDQHARLLSDKLQAELDHLDGYENARPVRTASSEQVRQPIYREGVDHWRHYEPWLEPLKVALGPVLGAYPAVPDFMAGSSIPD